MRKLNVFLVIGIFVTFLLHGIMGSLQLAGANADALKTVARICAGFIGAHVAVTAVLTVETLRTMKETGTGYFKENRLFWARRISGLAVLIPLVMHLFIFRASDAEVYRLQAFTTGKLISQLLLVASIALHVLTNLKPMLISLGIRSLKESFVDALIIISAVLLMFAAAFAIYYSRWMMN